MLTAEQLLIYAKLDIERVSKLLRTMFDNAGTARETYDKKIKADGIGFGISNNTEKYYKTLAKISFLDDLVAIPQNDKERESAIRRFCMRHIGSLDTGTSTGGSPSSRYFETLDRHVLNEIFQLIMPCFSAVKENRKVVVNSPIQAMHSGYILMLPVLAEAVYERITSFTRLPVHGVTQVATTGNFILADTSSVHVDASLPLVAGMNDNFYIEGYEEWVKGLQPNETVYYQLWIVDFPEPESRSIAFVYNETGTKKFIFYPKPNTNG